MLLRLSHFWQKITYREKTLLIGLGLVVLPFALINFLILPLISGINNLRSANDILQRQVVQFHDNVRRLRDLKSKNQAISNPLSENINQMLVDLGIEESAQIRTDKDNNHGYNWVISLENLRSDQLVRLIYELENSLPVVVINRIEVNESIQTKDMVRVVMLLKTE